MSLWNKILDSLKLTRTALSEAKGRGLKWAKAKYRYYTVKAETAFRLRKEGHPVTFIAIVIKGMPEVAEAMLEYDKAEVEYKNAQEAIQATKLETRVLESQYEREWGQSKGL